MKLILTNELSQGYSYIAPSILFTENIISDDLFTTSVDTKPNASNLMAVKLKVVILILLYVLILYY